MKRRTGLPAIATVLALATGPALAATGIQIDSNGADPGGTMITFFGPGLGGELNGGGNMVAVDAFVSGANTSTHIEGAWIGGQTAFSNTIGGTEYIFSYQYRIPVTVDYILVESGVNPITKVTLTQDTTRSSDFRLYLDLDPVTDGPDFDAGTGMGNMPASLPPDDGGLNTGQHLLAVGTVSINTGAFSLTQDSSTTFTDDSLATNRDGSPGSEDPVRSKDVSGSVDLLVDFTRQTDWVINDLVSEVGTPDMTIDMSLNSLGPLAPFNHTTPVLASMLVAGWDTTGNASSVDNSGFFGNYNTVTEILSGTPSTVEDVWNSLECGNTSSTCSGQYQTSVAVQINAVLVPEPASLALLGLGLSGLGFGARRRRTLKRAA